MTIKKVQSYSAPKSYQSAKMHIKVYFNDRPLFLTDAVDAEIEPYKHHDNAIFMDEFSPPAINSIIHEMRLQKIHAGVFYHTDFVKLRNAFIKKFTIIKASGGLVVSDDGHLLFIFRRGKWDLPKGKLDPGESLETCAVREVKEETGLMDAILQKHLITTYHTYEENGKQLLKETAWWLMHSPNQGSLEPQTDEQIMEAVWVAPDRLADYTKNTYLLIKDVLKSAGYG
jgi:8-oxo-dGTP pyrophosphatase MutT (NUDIX family)